MKGLTDSLPTTRASKPPPILGEDKLRRVVDAALDGMVVIDSSGTVLLYNAACERLFGYGAQEVLGNNVKMLMMPSDRRDHDTYITTEVGQHQMWAAQFFGFEEPNRWMTSGGLGTMGYGLPAAFGVQIAHPDALVIDIAGDASVQMTIQEMSSAVQYEAPIKIFILNNQYMGMVRQWQQLLHGNRLSHSYTEAMPDFVKLAEAYGCVGLRTSKPDELDDAIKEMISVDKPVIFDCRVANLANCFPMIPSGKAHNEMLLPDEATDEAVASAIDKEGKALV